MRASSSSVPALLVVTIASPALKSSAILLNRATLSTMSSAERFSAVGFVTAIFITLISDFAATACRLKAMTVVMKNNFPRSRNIASAFPESSWTCLVFRLKNRLDRSASGHRHHVFIHDEKCPETMKVVSVAFSGKIISQVSDIRSFADISYVS